ncbi:GNAT family N-acetyltransferase [Brevibacillus sp. M2.1A]|uniref:GNAT family N-acetyltransferase n=1 Tax=Brevibacillus TaxID=55080 RepID=UPI00156AF41F|nr:MULTISPECIES: GNAT family N-acetyltransferase [Brevibacillus]MCC8435156.1 GNAT family N-acetyltransferase [Brevibacillus sp. M2.1A]MCE0452257.1 GNAT family N-acetyltransferase [Brevibacillus sp. AF8]UKL01263.1 GNAT family N-acetyltransferase [Brevibacillus brevis]
MHVQFRKCTSDHDFAQFTLFFMRNRLEFSRMFSLSDTLAHILTFLPDSHLILIEGERGKLVGWGHYQYMTAERQPDPEGEICYIHSVIVEEKYRKSRVFLKGFRYLIRQVQTENAQVKQVTFCADAEHAYLNRLYSKFAQVAGEQEGYYGQENIYMSEINQLASYLGMDAIDVK